MDDFAIQISLYFRQLSIESKIIMSTSVFPIICFGEALWDVFPNGEFPGGAPMNVAVHLNQLGISAPVITRIGDDKRGKMLTEYLKSKKAPVDLIQTDSDYPTGIVKVEVSAEGIPAYDIVFPSAWDFISVDDALLKITGKSDLLVYGSLAVRNETSRNSLFSLLEAAKTRVFDVNLRPPYINREVIWELLLRSDIIKLNEDELNIIGEWVGSKGTDAVRICTAMDKKFRPQIILATFGNRGAMAYVKGEIVWHEGYKVQVVDTVGSGDAFLAAFLSRKQRGLSLAESLKFACAAGAFVAARKGANPEYSEKDLRSMMGDF